MRHTNRKRGLALGLLVLAMAGCEDPPLTIPVPVAGTSPGPSASPSGSPTPVASGAPVTASPTPAPSLAPGASPTPTRTPTPTPTPTPTASANTDAASQPITSLVFEAPTTSTSSDFTLTSVPVRVRAVVPTGVTIKEFTLYYDGREHTKQLSSSLSLSTDWNPGVATKTDTTAVPYGTHSLVAKATTTAGRTLELAFEFDKPLAFRGFTRQATDALTPTLPALPQERAWVRLYGHEDNKQLYALFGRGGDGQDMVAIHKLNLSDLGTSLGQWQYCTQGGLTPRHLPAVAGSKNHLYVIGGEMGAPLTPTNSVMVYDIADEASTSAPSLPMPLVDATAAVLGQYLYVFGGTSDGAPAGTSHRLYRLELETDGSPRGTAWEPMASLPAAQARRGASMINHRGSLYLFGGRNGSNVLMSTIYRYSPADAASSPNTWEDAGMLRAGFYQGAVGAIGTQVFLAGGVVDAAGAKTRAVVQYDSIRKTVTTLRTDQSLPGARSGMGAAVVGDRFYVVGGAEDTTDVTTGATSTNVVGDVLRANTL